MARADAATDGPNLASGLDTLEDRRCWNAAEAGKSGIRQRPIALESHDSGNLERGAIAKSTDDFIQRRGCAHVLIVPSGALIVRFRLAANSRGGG